MMNSVASFLNSVEQTKISVENTLSKAPVKRDSGKSGSNTDKKYSFSTQLKLFNNSLSVNTTQVNSPKGSEKEEVQKDFRK
mmetsp:Transcript_31311/g.30689  ORF Transcript_31311/g.30689 Transcript_31311/m.30689 type:complete len:81 (+) Transcript_31311:407-649(+)